MSLVGCSPWGRWGSDTTERLHFHFSLSCIGEGNGNPLQYSCLENPRDGGAWWAVVYGVTQSRTRLKWLSSSSIAFSEYDLSILVCELWVLNVQWLGNIFKAVKEPFLQTEFFKFQNRWLFFFYIQPVTQILFTHMLKSWNHSFMPVVVLYQLVNKQSGTTCQTEGEFGKHYSICHTVVQYFIPFIVL